MSFAPKGLSVSRRDDEDDEGDWYIGPRWRLVLASIPVVGALAAELFRYRNDSQEATHGAHASQAQVRATCALRCGRHHGARQ